MKKGLLLSIVASTVLFAGGDIAPVEPVAEAPAASCNDFYGSATVGGSFAYVDRNDSNVTGTAALYGVAAVLGVTKDIGAGLTFNAEVQGSALQGYLKSSADENGTRTPIQEAGGLTQFNLGYTFCNTAIKVGRFSIPENLSPLEYTDTNYWGLKDKAYEGVLVANTDLPDTTVWATYVHNLVVFPTNSNGQRARLGVVAAGLVNKSFADTTITLAGYYDLNGTGNQPWTWAAAGSIDHKWCDTDLSIGAAYVDWDNADKNGSYVVGASVKQSFESFDATLAATWSNDGIIYNKYTGTTNPIGGNDVWAVGLKLSTEALGGKLSGNASYSANDANQSKIQAGVGYSRKVTSNITVSADYRFQHVDFGDHTENGHRVRAKAVYKF